MAAQGSLHSLHIAKKNIHLVKVNEEKVDCRGAVVGEDGENSRTAGDSSGRSYVSKNEGDNNISDNDDESDESDGSSDSEGSNESEDSDDSDETASCESDSYESDSNESDGNKSDVDESGEGSETSNDEDTESDDDGRTEEDMGRTKQGKVRNKRKAAGRALSSSAQKRPRGSGDQILFSGERQITHEEAARLMTKPPRLHNRAQPGELCPDALSITLHKGLVRKLMNMAKKQNA